MGILHVNDVLAPQEEQTDRRTPWLENERPRGLVDGIEQPAAFAVMGFQPSKAGVYPGRVLASAWRLS